jgi:small subunit ribosomal protein S1
MEYNFPRDQIDTSQIPSYSQHPPEEPAREEAWRLAQQLHDSDGVVVLQALDCNKGGLLVTWKGLHGFVPASQLINFPCLYREEERLQELQRRRHQQLRLKIIELEPATRRLIWSERAALVAAGQREQLLQRIAPGDTLIGCVTNLTNFGVFVDLGGLEGLIHISELSWMRVNHPSDIVQPGEELQVLVLNVNAADGRVGLSLKRLRPDPWAGVNERYRPGQVVTGIVSNIVEYGAFVLLEEGLEGLVHLSQLAQGSVSDPRQVVETGDEVQARVLHVDGPARRLGLSLRQPE